MLGIGYVNFKQIPFIYSSCLRKLASPCNIIQYKYNKYQYKGENQNCVYWPILGSYNNWQIIHCIESRKQHESEDTDINVHIKKNDIRDIALNILKDISDNNYGEVSTIDKIQKMDIILLNGQVTVIIFSIHMRYKEIWSRLVIWFVVHFILIHLLISSNGILLI